MGAIVFILIFTIGIILSYVIGFLETTYQSDSYFGTSATSSSVSIVYHLIFSAVLCYFLLKKKSENGNKTVTAIAIINIILFAFVFSHFAFVEHENFISTFDNQRLAFYLHYASLAITIYF